MPVGSVCSTAAKTRDIDEWKLPARLSRLLLHDGLLVGAGLDGRLYIMRPGESEFETRFVSRSSLNGIECIGEDRVLVAAGSDAIAIDLASSNAAPIPLSQERSVASSIAANSQVAIVGRGDGSVLKIEDSTTTRLGNFGAFAGAAHWDAKRGQFILGLSEWAHRCAGLSGNGKTRRQRRRDNHVRFALDPRRLGQQRRLANH